MVGGAGLDVLGERGAPPPGLGNRGAGVVGCCDGVLVLGCGEGLEVFFQDPAGEQRDLELPEHRAVPVGAQGEGGGGFGVGFFGFEDPGQGLVGDLGGRVEQVAVVAVVAAVGPQVRGQRQVMTGAAGLPRMAEGSPEAEVGVVVDRVGLDHGLELDRRLGEAAGAIVGATERLTDRGLLGVPPRRLGQRLGRVLEVAVFEQLDPPSVEGVGRLGLLRAHVEKV